MSDRIILKLYPEEVEILENALEGYVDFLQNEYDSGIFEKPGDEECVRQTLSMAKELELFLTDVTESFRLKQLAEAEQRRLNETAEH